MSFNPLEQPTNMVEQASQNPPDNMVEQEQPAPPPAAPAPPSTPDPSQGGGIGQNQRQPTPADAKQAAVNKPTPQQSMHQSLFQKVLEGIGGGPIKTQVTDPNTGEVTVNTQHRGIKSIGMGILAGAISGMLAGEMSPTRVDANGHQDLSGAAQAGGEAGQQVTQRRNDAAQKLADKRFSSAAQVTQHNLSMHSMILGNTQLQGKVMQEGIESDSPILQAMQQSNPGAIMKQGVSEEQLQKMMADGAAHVTRQSVVRDGVTDVYDANGKQVMNADGTPKQAYTYTIFDPSTLVKMTEDLKKDNPNLANVAVGDTVPLRVLAKASMERGQMSNAEGFVNQWNEKASEINPKFKAVNLKSAIAKDPYLKQIVPLLSRYAGKDPDEVLNDMEKDKVDPNLIGRFASLFQVDRTKMAQMRAKAERDAKADEQIATHKIESAQDLEKQKDLALWKKKLGIVDTQMISTKPFTNDWMDANGNHYDLTSQPVALVEGDLDPTQLSKKSKEYDATIKAANAYSFARYGKRFDMPKAQIDMKEAQNPTVRATLRYLNSLTGTDNQSGNLGALVKLADKFGPTTWKSINDVKEWANRHRDQPEAVQYATAVVETADQVAKILQGGGSGGGTSDAKLKQANELFGSGSFSAKNVADVAQTLRELLANRKDEMVNGNRYLEKEFPKIIAEGDHSDNTQSQAKVPAGKVPAWKDGKLVGYADDNSGKGYVKF